MTQWLRRHPAASRLADRRPSLRSRQSSGFPSPDPIRDLALLRGRRLRHLQWQSHRRPEAMLRSWLSDHGLLWPCGVAELAHGELHRIVGQRRKCLAFAAVGSHDRRAPALVINRPDAPSGKPITHPSKDLANLSSRSCSLRLRSIQGVTGAKSGVSPSRVYPFKTRLPLTWPTAQGPRGKR